MQHILGVAFRIRTREEDKIGRSVYSCKYLGHQIVSRMDPDNSDIPVLIVDGVVAAKYRMAQEIRDKLICYSDVLRREKSSFKDAENEIKHNEGLSLEKATEERATAEKLMSDFLGRTY